MQPQVFEGRVVIDVWWCRYGTDALRYSLVTGVTPGQDVPLSMEKYATSPSITYHYYSG